MGRRVCRVGLAARTGDLRLGNLQHSPTLEVWLGWRAIQQWWWVTDSDRVRCGGTYLLGRDRVRVADEVSARKVRASLMALQTNFALHYL